VVLMSFIAGSVTLCPSPGQPWLAGLAGQLAMVHQHPAETFRWSFRSWLSEERLAPPPWTAAPQLWEQAIDLIQGPKPEARAVFIHRDYHPLNVLWREGAVNGVVDWINACRGPAAVDVSYCRINLALMFGPATADQFLAAYQAVVPEFVCPLYWDLDSTLDMCLPEPILYQPWQTFGLRGVTLEMLRRRADAYLKRMMAQR
jgi:aminoglycoside phosphotransferase (APT) family kinase protein